MEELFTGIYDRKSEGVHNESKFLNIRGIAGSSWNTKSGGLCISIGQGYHRKAIKNKPTENQRMGLLFNHEQLVRFHLLTVADNSYMDLLSASFLDFNAKTEHTFSPISLFTMGKLGLPSISWAIFMSKRLRWKYISAKKRSRHLKVFIPEFDKQSR